MYVNQTGLGQIMQPRRGHHGRRIVVPIALLKARGMGQAIAANGASVTCPGNIPAGDCVCPPGLNASDCAAYLASLAGEFTASGSPTPGYYPIPASISSVAGTANPANYPNPYTFNGQVYVGLPGFYPPPGTIPGPGPDPEAAREALISSGQVAAYCAANPADYQTCGYPQTALALLPGPSPTTTSIATPGGAPPQPTNVTLQNTSRPGQQFQVGDSWTLSITGMANSPVTDTASQNGVSLGTTPYGSTDSNGRFSLSGSMGSGTVGTWMEQWSVGGVPGPVLNFTVSAAPAAAAPAPASQTQPAAAGTSSTSSSGTTSAPQCLSFFSQFGIPDPCFGSFPIGVTTIAAGVAALILLSSFFGGRR
jgi:hypothetical protein